MNDETAGTAPPVSSCSSRLSAPIARIATPSPLANSTISVSVYACLASAADPEPNGTSSTICSDAGTCTWAAHPGPPLLCSCSIRRSHDGIVSSLPQLDGAAGSRRRVCGTVALIAIAQGRVVTVR